MALRKAQYLDECRGDGQVGVGAALCLLHHDDDALGFWADPELRAEIMARISALNETQLTYLIRAFNLYFGLVNTAEEAHTCVSHREGQDGGVATDSLCH